MKNLLGWVKDIAVAVVIAAIILTFFKPIIIRQTSMEPNFHNGDYVFLSTKAYTLFGDVQRGDVVVFHTQMKDDEDNDKNLIKRIIGLPGDTVEIIDGYVYLNGEILDEPYLQQQGISGEMDAVTVPEGAVFAMGDNRLVSLDSRDSEVGCVSQDEILGKVKIRVYPFNSFKIY